MRLARVVVAIPRRHHVRSLVDEAALHGARVDDGDGRARRQRHHARVVRVPAARGDGRAGQLERRHAADDFGRAGLPRSGARLSARAAARCAHGSRALRTRLHAPDAEAGLLDGCQAAPAVHGPQHSAWRRARVRVAARRACGMPRVRTAAWSWIPPQTPPRAPCRGTGACGDACGQGTPSGGAPAQWGSHPACGTALAGYRHSDARWPLPARRRTARVSAGRGAKRAGPLRRGAHPRRRCSRWPAGSGWSATAPGARPRACARTAGRARCCSPRRTPAGAPAPGAECNKPRTAVAPCGRAPRLAVAQRLGAQPACVRGRARPTRLRQQQEKRQAAPSAAHTAARASRARARAWFSSRMLSEPTTKRDLLASGTAANARVARMVYTAAMAAARAHAACSCARSPARRAPQACLACSHARMRRCAGGTAAPQQRAVEAASKWVWACNVRAQCSTCRSPAGLAGLSYVKILPRTLRGGSLGGTRGGSRGGLRAAPGRAHVVALAGWHCTVRVRCARPPRACRPRAGGPRP